MINPKPQLNPGSASALAPFSRSSHCFYTRSPPTLNPRRTNPPTGLPSYTPATQPPSLRSAPRAGDQQNAPWSSGDREGKTKYLAGWDVQTMTRMPNEALLVLCFRTLLCCPSCIASGVAGVFFWEPVGGSEQLHRPCSRLYWAGVNTAKQVQ